MSVFEALDALQPQIDSISASLKEIKQRDTTVEANVRQILKATSLVPKEKLGSLVCGLDARQLKLDDKRFKVAALQLEVDEMRSQVSETMTKQKAELAAVIVRDEDQDKVLIELREKVNLYEWLTHIKVGDSSSNHNVLVFNPSNVFVRPWNRCSQVSSEEKENFGSKSVADDIWDSMEVSDAWVHLLDPS